MSAPQKRSCSGKRRLTLRLSENMAFTEQPTVIVSANAGFCIGVKEAISRIEETLTAYRGREVYCLGMFIHNENVIEKYRNKGIRYVSSIEDVPDNSVVLFTSHGTPMDTRRRAEEKGLVIVDLICRYVLALQNIALKLQQSDYQVVLFGDKKHPEVKAILDIVPNAKVIDKQDILNDNLSFSVEKLGVISQTTQSTELYDRLMGFISSHMPEKEVRFYNTICRDVVDRQKEAADIAKICDLVFVLGGKKSANTKRLFEIASEFTKAYHIAVLDDFDPNACKGARSIGIISGTSTPDWFVDEVVSLVKKSIGLIRK